LLIHNETKGKPAYQGFLGAPPKTSLQRFAPIHSVPENGGWLGNMVQSATAAICLTFGDILMKKTLIALAVLASSGASFAQVTITGNLAMGYRATTAPAGDASGFGVDTSQINFSAKKTWAAA
jgi:hypothetical protein